MTRPARAILTAIAFGLTAAPTCPADTIPALFAAWEGRNGYLLRGTALATDTDGDGSADTRLTSASFDVTAADIPATATLVNAFLFWGGTQTENGSDDPSVRLTIP